MYTSLDEFKAEGYTSGYTWLQEGRKHPSEKGGYIPGGPGNYYDSRHNPTMYELYREGRKAWVAGWKDGINAYVTEHKLDFPQV